MNDFQIERLHKLQVKIASEIKRICIKHNIKFFLDAGSMLGAVRHEGFIPWDDDMDIGMLIDDYQKFIGIAECELGDEYYLDYYPKNKDIGLVFAKVRLRNTVYIEKMSSKMNGHTEIFVDVFPYFGRPENKILKYIQDTKLIFYSRVFMVKSGMDYWHGTSLLSRTVRALTTIAAKFGSYDYWFKKIDLVLKKSHGSNLAGVHDGASYRKWYYPIVYLEKMIWVKFENELFPIPQEYDKILKKCYGNYMELPPVEKRITHYIEMLDLGPYK